MYKRFENLGNFVPAFVWQNQILNSHNVICESPYATSPLSFCFPVQHRYVRLASYLQTDRQLQPHFALTLWNGTFTRNVLCFAIIHCGTTQSEVIINLSVSNEVNEIWKLVSRGKGITEKRTNREREVKRNSTPKNISLCLCLSSTNPFVTVFYIGNIMGQRIDQCIKFAVSFMWYTVISATGLVVLCVDVDKPTPEWRRGQ